MPRTIKTTLELSGESAYRKGLQSVDRALKSMSAELKESVENFSKSSKSQQNAESVMESYRKLTEQQKVKVDSLNDTVEACRKKHEEAAKAYDKAAAEHGENSKEALKAADAMYKAEKSLDEYSAKLKSAEKYLNSTTAEMRKFETETKKSSGIKDEFEKISAQVKAIHEQLKPVVKVCGEIASAAAKISFKTAEVGAKSVSAAINTAKKAFSVYTGAIAASSIAIGTWAIKTGAEFDTQMSSVASISCATGDELKELTDKAKEMGRTTSFSATESAQAFEYMAMAGWETNDMISGISGVMNLAAASGEDLAEVSDIVTDSMTALGYSADDASHYADVLAATATSANTNVSLLGESFKYCAPIAGTLGASAEDLSIALGLMANSGIKGSQAGNSLKNALVNMSKPTKDQAIAMEELGIEITKEFGSYKSLKEIMDTLRDTMGAVNVDLVDAEGNARDYDDILADLCETEEGLSQSSQLMSAATIFGKQNLAGMLAIINASDDDYQKLTDSIYGAWYTTDSLNNALNDCGTNLTDMASKLSSVGITQEEFDNALNNCGGSVKEFQDALVKMADEGTNWEEISETIGLSACELTGIFENVTGTAEEMAAIKLDNLQGDITLLKSNADGVALSISEKLNPALRFLVQSASNVITAFSSDGIGGALNQIGEIIPKIISAVSEELPTMLTSFIEGFNGVILSVVDAVIQALPVTIQSILPALFNGFNGLISGIMEMLPEAVLLLLDGFTMLFGSLINSVNLVLDKLIPMIPGIVNQITGAFAAKFPVLLDGALKLFEGLLKALSVAAEELFPMLPELINRVCETLVSNIDLIIEAAFELISALVLGLLDSLPEIIDAALKLIDGLVDGMLNALPELVRLAVEIIERLCGGLIQNLPKILKAAVEIVLKLVDGILENLPEIINAAIEMITALISGLLDCMPQIIEAAIELINGLTTGLIQNLPAIISAAIELVSGLADGLINNIPQIIECAAELIIGLQTGLIGAIPELIAAVPQLVAAIVGGIMETDWIQIGIDIVKGIGEGLVNGVGEIGSNIKAMAGDLLNGVKNALDIHSPSKLFRDKIGVFLAQGIGVGFENEMEKVTKQIQNAVPSDFNTVVNADMSGFKPTGQNVTHNQSFIININLNDMMINNVSDKRDIDDLCCQIGFEVQRAIISKGG